MAKTVKPKSKKMPPRFVTCNESYILGRHLNEANAVAMAEKACQPGQTYDRGYAEVGIYQLIKVVRSKTTPVEIEEVSCCRDTE
jgi:hypothetical protein